MLPDIRSDNMGRACLTKCWGWKGRGPPTTTRKIGPLVTPAKPGVGWGPEGNVYATKRAQHGIFLHHLIGDGGGRTVLVPKVQARVCGARPRQHAC